MTDSNISGSSSRAGRSTEIEKLLECFEEALVYEAIHYHNMSTERQLENQEATRAARAALLEYLEDRTLTAEEAQSILNEIPGDSVWTMDSAIEKLRRLSSPPATREEEVK